MLCLLLLALSTSHLIAAGHAQAIVTDRAHRFPDGFAKLAADLGIDSPFGAAGLAAVVGRVHDALLTSAWLGLACSALLLLCLSCVVKIVTPFEIVQVGASGRRLARGAGGGARVVVCGSAGGGGGSSGGADSSGGDGGSRGGR